MQTTDPRRTPRPDSEERTPKQGAAARPLPVNRRAPQRRGPNQSMLVFAAVLAVIVLAAVLVLVLVSRHNRARHLLGRSARHRGRAAGRHVPPVVLLQPDHQQRHAQGHHARRLTTGRARFLTILNFSRALAQSAPVRV